MTVLVNVLLLSLKLYNYVSTSQWKFEMPSLALNFDSQTSQSIYDIGSLIFVHICMNETWQCCLCSQRTSPTETSVVPSNTMVIKATTCTHQGSWTCESLSWNSTLNFFYHMQEYFFRPNPISIPPQPEDYRKVFGYKDIFVQHNNGSKFILLNRPQVTDKFCSYSDRTKVHKDIFHRNMKF